MWGPGDVEQPLMSATSAANSPSSFPSSPARQGSGPSHFQQQQQQMAQQQQLGQQQQQGVVERQSAARASSGSGVRRAEVVWTPHRAAWVLATVLGGGAVAGLLGIGGGMLVG